MYDAYIEYHGMAFLETKLCVLFFFFFHAEDFA